MFIPSPRTNGLVIPAWTLRHNGPSDLGIGDIHALHQCIDWAADNKIGFIQLLPLNETGSDHSPYNPISSIAFDPIYLDLADIPQLSTDDLTQARQLLADIPENVLTTKHVDYPVVKQAKRQLLEKAYQRYLAENSQNQTHPEQEALENFKAAQPKWLPDYCLFRWLQDKENGNESWKNWNPNYNTPEKARAYQKEQLTQQPEHTQQQLNYYAWVQYHAFRQWNTLRQHADQRDVQLMGDIPIGISHNSADVFLQPQWFDLNWFGGAPPEKFFKDDEFAIKWGQNWGVPHYNWDAIAKDEYQWWKRRIGKLTDLFHLFRIDHILGFYRIYSFPWHPQHNAEFLPLSKEEASARTGGPLPQFLPNPDDTPENKTLNRAHGHQHLSQILQHSQAAGANIIGEDLGEVPDYVRPHLLENNIAGFNVCHWLQKDNHVIPGSDYDECTFATYTTHDHPTLPALWNELYQNTQSDDKDLRQDALKNLRFLSEFSGLCEPQHKGDLTDPQPYDSKTKWALINALLASNSRYTALMINDLFDNENRYNTPGTTGPQNWTYRLPQTVQEFSSTESLKKETALLAELIQKNARA